MSNRIKIFELSTTTWFTEDEIKKLMDDFDLNIVEVEKILMLCMRFAISPESIMDTLNRMASIGIEASKAGEALRIALLEFKKIK